MTTRAQLAAAVRPFAPGGKLKAAHIPALDALADALGLPREGVAAHRLGKLSERFESGGRGPGTVSSGKGDPGGVSYGLYQLASKTPTLADWLQHEGAPWRAELLAGGQPGTGGFSAAWKAIAAREPGRFGDAQHAYIKRTHYDRAVAAVRSLNGVDLDAMHPAVRDATWSVAVQHGRALTILSRAIARAGTADVAKLLRAIYAERSAYVTAVANKYKGTERAGLLSVVNNRYPAELQAALAMAAA